MKISFGDRSFDIRKVTVMTGRGLDHLDIHVRFSEEMKDVLKDFPQAQEIFEDLILETKITKGQGTALAERLGLHVDEVINW